MPLAAHPVRPPARGTYLLVLAARRHGRVRIGRLGTLRLEPGYYVYTGSAFGPGGLAARLGRHLGSARRPHWHIDYLRPHLEPVEVWTAEELRLEHRWALGVAALAGATVPLPGFGSSDCRCPAHLAFFGRRPSAELAAVLRGARCSLLAL